MTDDPDGGPPDAPDRNTDQADGSDPEPGSPADHDPANPALVACERCGREWDLTPELEAVGNSAVEQFALEHRQHTGHFPDGVETWRARCRHCPERAERVERAGVRRWAETHLRHTGHAVEVEGSEASFVVE